MLIPDFMRLDFDNRVMPEVTAKEFSPISADIKEDENGKTILMDVPGFKKEDIQMKLTNGKLVIQAKRKEETDESEHCILQERAFGTFSRSFFIGYEVEQKDITAKFDDGVLTVRIPRKVAKEDCIPIE